MALMYHPNVIYPVLNRGFGLGLGSSFTIFGGAQPTPANLITNWTSYNTQFLLHHTGATWTHPINNTTVFVSLTTLPAAAVANATGIGTWAVLWASAVTQGNLANTTIPNTYFVLVPVSDQAGQGSIRYVSNSFTAATSYSVLDGTISVSI